MACGCFKLCQKANYFSTKCSEASFWGIGTTLILQKLTIISKEGATCPTKEFHTVRSFNFWSYLDEKEFHYRCTFPVKNGRMTFSYISGNKMLMELFSYHSRYWSMFRGALLSLLRNEKPDDALHPLYGFQYNQTPNFAANILPSLCKNWQRTNMDLNCHAGKVDSGRVYLSYVTKESARCRKQCQLSFDSDCTHMKNQ